MSNFMTVVTPVFRADGAAPANPNRGPLPRAQPPSVARGNANNIVRDGVSLPTE